MSLRSLTDNLRVSLYFLFTTVTLIISFFPEGFILYYFLTNDQAEIVLYLLIPLSLFLSYCITVILFGVIHSQLVVRLFLPFRIKPGEYHGSKGRLIEVRVTADGIFKSMLKFFQFLPIFWSAILFPYLMRLYGFKCGGNAYIATKTAIDTCLVEIGKNCFIGMNAMLKGYERKRNGTIVVNPTKIGNRCTIGTYAIVEPGVVLGDRSILGAKSIFVKGQKINPNEIWIGHPAKFLKNRG